MFVPAAMKTRYFILPAALLWGALSLPGQSTDTPVDWDRARQLFQREQRGEKLAEEDQNYLNRAKEMRRKGAARPEAGAAQRKAPESLKPLCDMTADDRYEGEDGGLYGGGGNEPPEALKKAAGGALEKIQPLDREGKPAEEGRIVLVSISMSNATQEFSFFKRIADADPRKSDRLTIVDCAQGGQAMAEWAPPAGRPWEEAMRRVSSSGVTPAQVQVAWVKLANKNPSGSMSAHLSKLEADTSAVLRNARERFPNLRIAYLGSRIWAGNARGGLNPEPYAYESAFAARNLIRGQMESGGAPASGGVPLLLWGPYLWAEGEKGRKLDSLKYMPEDFAPDGVHPSNSGREKVALQLLDFFATNPLAKSWFAKP